MDKGKKDLLISIFVYSAMVLVALVIMFTSIYFIYKKAKEPTHIKFDYSTIQQIKEEKEVIFDNKKYILTEK